MQIAKSIATVYGVFIIFTGFATAQVQNPSEPYIREDTPPKLCTGDTWTYFGNEYIAATPWISTVQAVNNGVATILRQGAPEVGEKRERLETRLANGNISQLADSRYEPDNQDFAFPLVVGKTWALNQNNPGAAGDILVKTGTAEVKAREQLQTKAGSLDTIRIQQYGNIRSTNTKFAASYQYTYWYAPAAKTIVKYEYQHTNTGPRSGNAHRTGEITAFKVSTCD